MDEQLTGASSSLPPFSSLCSSNIESLLDALLPDDDDDTLRGHLSYPETRSTSDVDMDDGYGYSQFSATGDTFHNQSTPYSPQYYNNQGYDDSFHSNGLVETLDQLLASSYSTSSPVPLSSSCFSSSYSSPVTNSPSSYSPSSYSPLTSRSSSYQAESNFPKVTSSSLYYPYSDPQSTSLRPLDSGFRQKISLNTPHSKTTEPWRENVAKKILEAYYSPLNLKSEFLATQSALDEFQSLTLKEAVAAFHDLTLCNSSMGPDACTNRFVDTCSKVRAYRRLHIEDKVTLLTQVFFDTITMKSIITYDHLTDSWTCSGKRVDRSEVYRMDPILHDGLVDIIQTYPDRWRNDLTAAAIIYLIVIFNPDLPNLKFSESIRIEQYGYIYLLRRYLEATCESPCDASDYHYRLMCKIEQIQQLRKHMIALFDSVHLGSVSPFKNLIATLVK